jgi:ABC-type transport system substrate-binding protein
MKNGKLSKVTYLYTCFFITLIMFFAISYVTPVSVAAADTPKRGGVLRYGINQDYPTIGNPATQQYSSGAPITDICLEGLLILNETGEPKPWLATGWEYDNHAGYMYESSQSCHADTPDSFGYA